MNLLKIIFIIITLIFTLVGIDIIFAQNCNPSLDIYCDPYYSEECDPYYNSTCNPQKDPYCDPDYPQKCDTKYDPFCHPNKCTKNNLENCISQTDCEEVGGCWYDNRCNYKPQCNINNLEYCTTETQCKEVGGYWKNGNCISEPPEKVITKIEKGEKDIENLAANFEPNKLEQAVEEVKDFDKLTETAVKGGAHYEQLKKITEFSPKNCY